jgi:cardiolipin synthase
MLSIIGGSHALLHRTSPRSAFIWISTVFSLPLIGLLLYCTLGIDRVHRRTLFKRHRREDWRNRSAESSCEEADTSGHGTVNIEPLTLLKTITGELTSQPLLQGNDFKLLKDGEETYPSMFEAINKAHSHIHVTTYRLDNDETGRAFLEALCTAAERGLSVRMIYDAIGSIRTPSSLFAKAAKRGVQMTSFFPLHPLALPAQFNLRNHRKIMVVDGVLGYFGGLNFRDHHLVSRSAPGPRSRDLHVRVAGPLVHQLQECFIEDWYYATEEALLSTKYFPSQKQQGTGIGRVITGGPDEEHDHIRLLFFSAITAARKKINLITPYFIPDPALKYALQSAALKGVEVEIFLPSETDHPIVRRASMVHLAPLLESGVRIFEHPPPFVHAKACIVDNLWCLMGSANFDPRSFNLSYEIMVEIEEPAFLASLLSWVEDSRTLVSEIKPDFLKSRPIQSRLFDRVCNLFSPFL